MRPSVNKSGWVRKPAHSRDGYPLPQVLTELGAVEVTMNCIGNPNCSGEGITVVSNEHVKFTATPPGMKYGGSYGDGYATPLRPFVYEEDEYD